jgi:hypothetical protein
MKRYNAIMSKYNDLLALCYLTTNSIHTQWIGHLEEIIGGCNNDVDAHGWEGNC